MGFDEAAVAMRGALRAATGRDPSREALALALGKSALETGRWKSLYNWNWGNIRPSKGDAGLYTCFPICNEIERDGKLHWYTPQGEVVSRANLTVIGQRYEAPPGHPASRFKAWENAFDGAEAYVTFVAGGRYAAAWQRLLAGDAAGYSKALKAAGYYTADEALYTKGVVNLQREFLGKLGGLNPEPADLRDTDPAPPPSASERPTLRNGSEGPYVVELQQLLNLANRGIPALLADGKFGPKTESVLRAYQRARPLAPDGVCGKFTWASLLGGK
jgi:hypothetical protein